MKIIEAGPSNEEFQELMNELSGLFNIKEIKEEEALKKRERVIRNSAQKSEANIGA